MVAASLVAVVLSGRGDAQGQRALSVTGGSATEVVGVTSRAVTLVPLLIFVPDPRALFTLDGSATAFDNRQRVGTK
jgi:hypothetical protein